MVATTDVGEGGPTGPAAPVHSSNATVDPGMGQDLTVIGMTAPVGPGSDQARLRCREPDGPADFYNLSLSLIQLNGSFGF